MFEASGEGIGDQAAMVVGEIIQVVRRGRYDVRVEVVVQGEAQ